MTTGNESFDLFLQGNKDLFVGSSQIKDISDLQDLKLQNNPFSFNPYVQIQQQQQQQQNSQFSFKQEQQSKNQPYVPSKLRFRNQSCFHDVSNMMEPGQQDASPHKIIDDNMFYQPTHRQVSFNQQNLITKPSQATNLEEQKYKKMVKDLSSHQKSMAFVNGIPQGNHKAFIKRHLMSLLDLGKVEYLAYNDRSNWIIVVGSHDEIESLEQLELQFMNANKDLLIGVHPLGKMNLMMFCESDLKHLKVKDKEDIDQEF